MKPAFALSLSQDGIELFQRVPGGWTLVGTADPEADDLAEALARLRAEASVRAPDGLTTKLILPNSQLLYADLVAPGPDRASRRRQIAEQLEGRTPYAVGDLVFDWSGTGSRVHVAVVAKITLEEAEEFAEANGFGPVCFVASPEDGQFAGEPWFGMAGRAGSHLPEGARLDRDQDPLRRSLIAAPVREGDADAAEVNEEPAAETAAAETAEPAPEPEAEVLSVAETVVAVELVAEAPEAVGTEVVEPPFVALEDEDEAAEPAAADDTAIPAEAAAPAQPVTTVAPGTVETEAPPAPPEPDPVEAKGADRVVAEAEAPAATTDSADLPTDAAALVAEEADVAARPAAESTAAEGTAEEIPGVENHPAESATILAATFTSRRNRTAPGSNLSVLADLPSAASPGSASARRLSVVAERTPAPGPALATATPSAPRLGAAGDGLGVTAAALASPAPVEVPPTDPAAFRRPGGRTGKRRDPKVAKAPGTKPNTILRRVLSRAASAAAAPKPLRRQPKPVSAEAAEMTVFGARRQPQIGGKPRYLGMMLTVGLLFLMVAVALWSQLFTGEQAQAPTDLPETQAAVSAPAALPEAPDAVAPAEPEADVAADLAVVEPAPDSVPPADGEAAAEAVPDAVPAPLPDEPAAVASASTSDASAATAAAPEADATAGAASGAIASAAGSLWTPSEGLASVPATEDTATPRRDETDLAPDTVVTPLPETQALAPDGGPATEAEPVPFASLLRYGPDGLIVATPEGVLAPGGFTVISGRPTLVPPDRPARQVPITTAPAAPADPTAAAIPATAPVAAPGDAVLSDPTALPQADLPARRPLPRPASLDTGAAAAPEAGIALAAEAGAASQPPAPADPRLAALKPRTRPDTVAARASALRETEAAFAAAAAAAESAAPAQFPNATRFAVASSRRPSSRPQDFSQAVSAALAEAAASPEPEQLASAAVPAANAKPAPKPEAAATPEPQPEPEPAAPAEEVDEPEPETAAPDIPTRASVAKQATIKNAIDLGKINLIGVYGSSSDRRALVRTGNGRFVRVKVGDRLDGGRVAAIGDGQLSYVKNGRTIVLKMIRDS